MNIIEVTYCIIIMLVIVNAMLAFRSENYQSLSDLQELQMAIDQTKSELPKDYTYTMHSMMPDEKGNWATKFKLMYGNTKLLITNNPNNMSETSTIEFLINTDNKNSIKIGTKGKTYKDVTIIPLCASMKNMIESYQSEATPSIPTGMPSRPTPLPPKPNLANLFDALSLGEVMIIYSNGVLYMITKMEDKPELSMMTVKDILPIKEGLMIYTNKEIKFYDDKK